MNKVSESKLHVRVDGNWVDISVLRVGDTVRFTNNSMEPFNDAVVRNVTVDRGGNRKVFFARPFAKTIIPAQYREHIGEHIGELAESWTADVLFKNDGIVMTSGVVILLRGGFKSAEGPDPDFAPHYPAGSLDGGVWVQRQAPDGRWVDSVGLTDSERDTRLRRARDILEGMKRLEGGKWRVVERREIVAIEEGGTK